MSFLASCQRAKWLQVGEVGLVGVCSFLWEKNSIIYNTVMNKKIIDKKNQFLVVAAAEKMSALMTADYLEECARRGRREEFEAILAKIPAVEPPDYDRL